MGDQESPTGLPTLQEEDLKALSSEERQRRDGELPREEPLREKPQEQEAKDVSEPVEVGGSEDPGVVPEAEGPADSTEIRADRSSEEAPSEEPLEITQDELSAIVD